MFVHSCENNSEISPFNPNMTYGTVSDIEGNVYRTIQIGTQEWMAENLKTTKLNDDTPIQLITNNATWYNLSTPAYCLYFNNPVRYGTIYGALYNWHVITTEKLCPNGWHVPTNAEWTTMMNYLVTEGYNYDGTTDVNTLNKVAKSLASATGWISSTNKGAVGNTDYPDKKNATGFSALPGGGLTNDAFYFSGQGEAAAWWSSTEYDATEVY
jgi:uncharacterized protein (TIGR02145 family)